LEAVSCASTTTCTAVGSSPGALVVRWTGSSQPIQR
jgi:hypothetical protein